MKKQRSATEGKANGCANRVVRCGVGVGLLLLKAKSEGTAKVQQRDIEAIASKLKD